ncbi:hypothetical protein MTO96_024325, partial [Rhipicephalus appendiculatus]
MGKLQATPQKADAIMDVIQEVIEKYPSDVEVAKRVALGRKALRDIFAEMGRVDPLGTQSAGEDEIVVDSVWVAASLKADGYEVIVDAGGSRTSSRATCTDN